MTPLQADMLARAGDVLLFHRPTTFANFSKDLMGTTMTTLIHLTTRSRFNHAAMALGDGKMVEATSAGVCVSDISSSNDDITIVPMTYEDADDKEDVLAWATGRVGTHYGYLNAFICGLRNLFPGRLQVSWGDTIICSELVADALSRAGFDFGKDAGLVSPGDLATYFGVPRK